MKFNGNILVLVLCAAMVSAVPLHASMINSILYQTLPGNNTSFLDAAGYQANWNALLALYPSGAPGYGSTSVVSFTDLSNHATIGGYNSNIAFHTVIHITVTGTELWNMQFGPDYGFGGAVFIDSNPVAYNPNDMWWNSTWNDPSQIFSLNTTFSPGSHVIELFGQEDCCDGGSSGRYSIGEGNTDYQAFTATPEPGSYGLLTLGLSGLVFARRMKRNQNR